MIEMARHVESLITNVTKALRHYEQWVYRDAITDFNASDINEGITSLPLSWGTYSSTWDSAGTTSCPLCDRRSFALIETETGQTYQNACLDWVAEFSFATSDNAQLANNLDFNVAFDYFKMDKWLLKWAVLLEKQSADYLNVTMTFLYFSYFLWIVWAILLVLFVMAKVKAADLPFQVTLNLLKRLPPNSLSRDTLKILSEHRWDFRLDGAESDASSYDEMVNALPNPVIVIDSTQMILAYNHAAEALFDCATQSAINKNLFEVMTIRLKENYVQGNDPNAGTDFQDLVNAYLFDEYSPVEREHEMIGRRDDQVTWYKVTFLPMYDESTEQFPTQRHAATTFALFFHDIGDTVRQQNLVQQELGRYRSILMQILPPRIVQSLENNPNERISMDVKKAAISFCDIVTFTPWCATTQAGIVYNALNLTFKKFDDLCHGYDLVTKIKCIGDCYMTAAGVFQTNPDLEAPRQMIKFCLDCIDGIMFVNNTLGLHLQVRIGVHYGGPMSAGTMGIYKPVFDIWGETVNKAEEMESQGVAMKVHVSSEMYETIQGEPYNFEMWDDGSVIVTRLQRDAAEQSMDE
jgi:class 3 adenylate cyclase/PAS domain-containing protein